MVYMVEQLKLELLILPTIFCWCRTQTNQLPYFLSLVFLEILVVENTTRIVENSCMYSWHNLDIPMTTLTFVACKLSKLFCAPNSSHLYTQGLKCIGKWGNKPNTAVSPGE